MTTFMKSPQLFLTSESVTEGHPDKLCDQISDAVLDALLAVDPESRVACETAATTGLVVVMGEISTKSWIDVPKIVRDTIMQAGYAGRVRLRRRDLWRDRLHQRAVERHRPGRGRCPGAPHRRDDR